MKTIYDIVALQISWFMSVKITNDTPDRVLTLHFFFLSSSHTVFLRTHILELVLYSTPWSKKTKECILTVWKSGSPRVLLSGRVAYMSFVWEGAELFMEKVDFYSIMHSKARVQEQRCKKQGLRVLQNSTFLRFFANFVRFSAIFFSLNVQIRNTLKNTIFTACKWCRLCKYYFNSMVISCNTGRKEEKECTRAKYVIYAVFQWFELCQNLRNFSAKSKIPDVKNWQKKAHWNSVQEMHNLK